MNPHNALQARRLQKSWGMTIVSRESVRIESKSERERYFVTHVTNFETFMIRGIYKGYCLRKGSQGDEGSDDTVYPQGLMIRILPVDQQRHQLMIRHRHNIEQLLRRLRMNVSMKKLPKVSDTFTLLDYFVLEVFDVCDWLEIFCLLFVLIVYLHIHSRVLHNPIVS